MTEYVTYLPFGEIKDAYGAEPLLWLYTNLKGEFWLENSTTQEMDRQYTKIYFKEKQDLEHFVLMWGEYLWNENDF